MEKVVTLAAQTVEERAALAALAAVRFLPGSWARRYTERLRQSRTGPGPAAPFTAEERENVRRILYAYRRQLPAYAALTANWPLPPKSGGGTRRSPGPPSAFTAGIKRAILPARQRGRAPAPPVKKAGLRLS